MKPNHVENTQAATLRQDIAPGHSIEVSGEGMIGWHFVVAKLGDPTHPVATLRKNGNSEWSLVGANGTVIAGPVKFIAMLHDRVVEFVSFP